MQVKEIGIIDVREWRAVVDMRTGLNLPAAGADVEPLYGLLGDFPYPGDLSGLGSSWVSDIALELNRLLNPSLMMLVYAGPSLQAMYGEAVGGPAPELRSARSEIDRFLSSSGLNYVILGLGGMVELKAFADLGGLDGLALGSGHPGSIAGIYDPSAEDLSYMQGLKEVVRIITREELREEFGGVDIFYERCPELLIEFAEGYAAKGFGVPPRRTFSLPGRDMEIPFSTDLNSTVPVKSLIDLEGAVRETISRGKRVALILVEGWGTGSFPWDFVPLTNSMGWFRYGTGEGQYLAISSGTHMVDHGYPPCLRYYREDDLYPFSGIFNKLPEDVLGQRTDGLTIAVGNRSIYTHACLGADITFECFARTLYNYGVMAVLRERTGVRERVPLSGLSPR